MDIKIPKMKTFCCGCSVELGAKIVGWLQVVSTLALLILVVVFITIHGYSSYFLNGEASHYRYEHSFEKDDNTEMALVTHIIMGISLLYGIKQRNQVYIEPWLIKSVISMSLNLFTFVSSLVIRLARFTEWAYFSAVIFLVFETYMFLVVLSFYRNLKEDNDSSTDISEKA